MKRTALIFFFALLAVGAASAATKDYYFPEVRVEIVLDKDGGFRVDEFLTYEFQGSFSFAYVRIPRAFSRQGRSYEAVLSDFTVSDEQGRPLACESGTSGGLFQAKWHYSARDERRTFHLHYRIGGGILSYPGVTELYWKVIGDDWDRPTKKVSIEVRLPGPLPRISDLNVWGHGPLTAWAEVLDAGTARFSAFNVPSRQFVEIRVVWPSGVVSGVPAAGESLDSIKREEAGFVRDTIERVQRAREDDARRAAEDKRRRQVFFKILGAWGIWQIVGPILWLLFYSQSWSRVGKDYRFEGLPEYERELPSDLPPAFVQVLMREGRGVTPAAFTATIFDLARKGWVGMEDLTVEKHSILGTRRHPDTRISLLKDFESSTELRDFEKDLLDMLFGKLGDPGQRKGSSFTLDNLKDYLRKEPQEFQKWYRDWGKGIKEATKPLGFLEPESLRARNRFLLVTLPVGILTLSPVLLILSAVLIPTLKRRAPGWARENELWKAFKRFLDDFSEFRELPPEALKLWEHYLVFGVLFGNAKKILKALPIILRDEHAVVPTWYAGASRAAFLSSAGNLTAMVNSIEHMATTVSMASTSAAHYSSGGGGGFSGGGGGGGGGGGAGAG